jgi:hypothetical protein
VKGLPVAILWCVVVPAAASAQSIPTPSAPLVDTLASVRAADMARLVAWASQPVAPAAVAGPAGVAEAKILALAPPDRGALLYWLNAHGRGALQAQGASDTDIGVPYYPIDYALVPAPFPAGVTPLTMPVELLPATPAPAPPPQRRTHFGFLGSLLPALQIPIASSSSSSTSTTTSVNGNSTEFNQTTQSSGASVSIGGNPWQAIGSLIDSSVDRSPAAPVAPPPAPWRNLPFATSSLSAPGSMIALNRGFAAVSQDGTEGVACISFVNQSSAIVSQIDVDIEVLDGLGFIKRVQTLQRTGSFGPGTEVGGPSGPQTVAAARANCVIDGRNSLDDPTDPFSNASAVVYSVRQVFYADGTSWLQPGANSWGS